MYVHGNFLAIKRILESRRIWDTCTAEGAKVSEAQRKVTDDAKLKDVKANNYPFQVIDRSISETILNKDMAESISDSLKQKCQGSTKV